jgi:hypothetical protein
MRSWITILILAILPVAARAAGGDVVLSQWNPNGTATVNRILSLPASDALFWLNHATGQPQYVTLGTNLAIVGSQLQVFGGGTPLTSVGLTMPSSVFTVGNSPLTSNGTIGVTLANQAVNLVWASPASGPSGPPTFRSLASADIPALPYVSSVALVLPSSIITVTGSPVTSSGTLTGTLATQTANFVWAGPSSGAASAPTFRALVTTDIPSGLAYVTSVALSPPSSIISVSGSPITSSGTFTESLQTQVKNTVWAGPTTGSNAAPTFRSLVGSDLPVPSATTLGGIESITSAAHNWVAYIDTSGVPHQSQPNYTDLSGVLPNPGASTLGGIESYAAVTNQWINAISTAGVPSSTQPAFSNISGQATLAQLPSIGAGTALVNVTVGSAVPTATLLTSLPDTILNLASTGIVDRTAANTYGILTFTGGSLGYSAGVLTLSGDASSPGNSQYYGTNGSGTKGWYTLTAGGNVSTSGTITSGQTAQWNSTTTLISVANTGTGSYVLATSPTLVTPVLGVATATSLNKVAFTAPTTAVTFAFGTDNATFTMQGTDTYIGRATTDTLTNKTYDTAGTGNSFKINGTGITAVTGTGSVVLAASPTLTGAPIAPTASALTNSTQIATTAYADAAVAVVHGALNSKSAAYTTVLADQFGTLYHPSADTTARTFTIDSNANVAFPLNTVINFFNDVSAGTLTIAITSDTLVTANSGATGSVTLAAGHTASALKVATTRWVINVN